VYRPKRYIDIFAQMSAADPVLGSLQARQAVNYCIDRKACNQQAFLGLGQQPGYMVSPPELGFSESLVPYSTQNLAKAKQLVASSGIAGKSVNVICQNSLFWPQLGQILDQDLKAIGLKPTTRYLDTGTFTKIVTDPTQYSIALYQRSAFVPDPDNKLSPLLTADGAGSEVAIAKLPAPVQNQVQKMLAQAKSTTNQAQRAALYVNLQKYVIANEMNYSMMQNIFTPVASAKTLNNLNADALGTYRLFLEKTGFAA
jgi:peptide/nickel transport system substrate-binding protein